MKSSPEKPKQEDSTQNPLNRLKQLLKERLLWREMRSRTNQPQEQKQPNGISEERPRPAVGTPPLD